MIAFCFYSVFIHGKPVQRRNRGDRAAGGVKPEANNEEEGRRIAMVPPTDVLAEVLMVTATSVESRAVIDAFAELTGQPARPVSVEDRVYHDLGQIQGARVMLALTEMGSGGLGASQQTVQKGIAALQPKAVMLVGIAFGVDERKQAIGDVLVSRQLLLYESQRIGEGKIIPRGDKPHASPWLLNYLNSAHLYWHEPAVAVRFGLVLSGEKLVDSLDYREQLKPFGPEAVGGEMEGAGLYVACQDAKVDWIVVKAICDWADGHKAEDKDARQRLAARNAAAFVAHALRHVPLVLTGQAISAQSAKSMTPEKPGYLPGPNLGPVKINLCGRLGSDWPNLADYCEIPRADRARFERGWEAQGVWEWLEARGRLAELTAGLRYIQRNDLADLLLKALPGFPR